MIFSGFVTDAEKTFLNIKRLDPTLIVTIHIVKIATLHLRIKGN